MRRFLSRSRSVPLSPSWSPSEQSPSPTLIDFPTEHAEKAVVDRTSSTSVSPHATSDIPLCGCRDAPSSLQRLCGTTAQVSTNDAPRDCCFEVVSKLPHPGVGGGTTSRVVIHDVHLAAACREVIGDCPQDSGPLELDLHPLLALLPALEQYRDKKAASRSNDAALPATCSLATYLRQEHGGTLAKFADLTSRGEITFDALAAIFTPGTTVVARCTVTGEWRAYKLRSATTVRTSPIEVYDLVCEGVDMVDESPSGHCQCCSVYGSPPASPVRSPSALGPLHSADPGAPRTGMHAYGRTRHRFLIAHFDGVVKISSLDVYPLTYHPDAGRLEASLLARGREWLALQGIHHVQYTGSAACTASVGDCKTTVKYKVDSYVILDRGGFRRLNPAHEMPSAEIDHDAQASLALIEPEHLMLAPPVLYGYSLTDKRWLMLNVEHIKPTLQTGVVLPSLRGLNCKTFDTSPTSRAAIPTINLDSCERLPVNRCLLASTDELAAPRSGTANDVQPPAIAEVMEERLVTALAVAKAETTADVQRLWQEDISAFAAGFEERYMRGLAKLSAKHREEFAVHRQIMRVVLMTSGVLILLVLVVLYRLLFPSMRTCRWSGPMHFTIPILSPFASVVEHESSFKFPQIMLLLVALGLFCFLRLRYFLSRK